MKAVVLVGGEGTRLRPLTETIPKPLLPFMNRPYLDHVLAHLAGHGVEEAILSSSYLEEEFRAFLDARRGPPSVTWITEEQPLGTSGAVAGAAHLLNDTFLVLNGDVLTDLDLGALMRFHRDRGAVATIALKRVDDARPFGLVERDDDERVLAFREKPSERIPGTINAGTYVLEPRALDRVPRGVAVSIERETFPDLIERGEPVFGAVSDPYWRDLGTPAAYLEAHLDALEGRIGEYEAPLIGADADVAGEASIGRLTVLGDRVVIAAGAAVDRSVVHDGAELGERAIVERTIVGRSVTIGAGSVVRGSVLAEASSVEAGATIDGASLGPGTVASL